MYVVLKKAQNVPVYTVCPEGKDGPHPHSAPRPALTLRVLPSVELEETTLPSVRPKRLQNLSLVHKKLTRQKI